MDQNPPHQRPVSLGPPPETEEEGCCPHGPQSRALPCALLMQHLWEPGALCGGPGMQKGEQPWKGSPAGASPPGTGPAVLWSLSWGQEA